MKRVLALTAGVLVALVPTGSAFAGTVPGNAYGNCQHSSSGGEAHTALMPEVGHGQGNGGLVQLGKGDSAFGQAFEHEVIEVAMLCQFERRFDAVARIAGAAADA